MTDKTTLDIFIDIVEGRGMWKSRTPEECYVTHQGVATEEQYLQAWLTVGLTNPWVKLAGDPPFTLESFSRCADISQLLDRFEHGNWCLGQAFYLYDKKQPNNTLCFIQQVDGGDEWLTIKERLGFESVSFGFIIRKDGREKAESLIRRMQAATLEQCKKLEY